MKGLPLWAYLLVGASGGAICAVIAALKAVVGKLGGLDPALVGMVYVGGGLAWGAIAFVLDSTKLGLWLRLFLGLLPATHLVGWLVFDEAFWPVGIGFAWCMSALVATPIHYQASDVRKRGR